MYQIKKIKNLVKITKGRHYPSPSVSQFWDHKKGFLWLKIGDIKPYTNDSKCKLSQKGAETIKNAQNFLFKKNSFVMAMVGVGSVGKIGWLIDNFYSSTAIINFNCDDLILKKYLYYYFYKNRSKIEWFQNGTTGLKSIKLWQLERFEINLPDFETQKKIVEEIEFFSHQQKIIKKKIIKFEKLFKLRLFQIFNDLKKNNSNCQKELIKNLVKISQGRGYPSPLKKSFWDHKNGFLCLKGGDIKPYIYDSKYKLSQKGVETIRNYEIFLFKKDSFVIPRVGSIGKVGWLKKNFYASDCLFNLDCHDLILKKYLYYFFKKNHSKILSLKYGTSNPRFNIKELRNFKINLPDRETQKKVVEELDLWSRKIKILKEKEKSYSRLIKLLIHKKIK